MSAPSRDAFVPVGRADELAPGQSRKFLLQCTGGEIEAFVVNHGGALYAYVNRCCHIPLTMDWVENQFFTDDGAYIQCATHGALYEPASGECVAGPPLGKWDRGADHRAGRGDLGQLSRVRARRGAPVLPAGRLVRNDPRRVGALRAARSAAPTR